MVHSFRSHRLKEGMVAYLKRKRNKSFIIDDRNYLLARYIVLVTELVSQLNHVHRFQLMHYIAINQTFPYILMHGIYYCDPNFLKLFPEQEKAFIHSGEFRAYQSLVNKKN